MSPSQPVIVVVGAQTHLGGRVAGCLAARGAAVVAVSGVEAGPGPLVTAIVEGAAGRRVAAVVHAEVDEALCAPRPLVETTAEDWRERCARPVASALWTANAAYTVLTGEGRGGTVGFVCPSVGLTGATGHVALASAAESVRLLAKSAARRWGRHRITVNAFAPPLAACLPGPATQTAEVNATAFPDVDAADEIAALVTTLVAPDAPHLTGATLGTDGGELMLP